MRNKFYNHIVRLLFPCVAFSAITGFLAAILVTLFKIMAEWVLRASACAYEAVRAKPIWLPIIVIAVALIGFAQSLLLSTSHSCKGGGIPTSVAAIKGILSFRWTSGIFLLPLSALLTFLAGLPLGTEGPCVQMGTAVGDGVIKSLGKEKHKGWRRYIMTGGASAGFSIATASPVSAIIFAMEEIHKHFSPILLSVASISVITAQITSKALASIGIGEVGFFHLPKIQALPTVLFFAPLLLGLVSGVFSILFTRLYHHIDRIMRTILKRFSAKIVLPILFSVVSIVGFFFADTLGSGDSLISSLFSANSAWYLLILLLLIRAIGMILCNTSGATGGIFLPTLTFGAIIGSLCANVMISLGWIGEEYYLLMVVLGITSFLGSTSRIPLTACVFAIEALSGINNVLPIVISTIVALLIVEASGLEDLTDKVIDAKLHKVTKGKTPFDVEVSLTVNPNSFVVGKELRDVLWPNSCVVVAFKRAKPSKKYSVISEGDVITVKYVTYDPSATTKELNDLVGEQTEQIIQIMNPCEDHT